SGGDSTITALAAAMLDRTGGTSADSSPASSWIKLLDVALGYDDNVALLEESSLPAGLWSGSRLLELFGLVSGRVGPTTAVRLDARAYVVRYADAADFGQDAFRVGFAYMWEAGSWRIDAGSYYDYGVLSGQAFE